MIFDKITNTIDHVNGYNKILESIKCQYDFMYSGISDMYNEKDKLDTELSHLYIKKLTNYYALLAEMYSVYFESQEELSQRLKNYNYNNIGDLVNPLFHAYNELDYFIRTVKEIYNDNDWSLFGSFPLDFFVVRKDINDLI